MHVPYIITNGINKMIFNPRPQYTRYLNRNIPNNIPLVELDFLFYERLTTLLWSYYFGMLLYYGP